MANEADIADEFIKHYKQHRAMYASNVPPVLEGAHYVCAECGEPNDVRGGMGYGRCIECQEEVDRDD